MRETTTRLVAQFHHKFGLGTADRPSLANLELIKPRLKHLAEELEELTKAVETRDIIEIADALADLDYLIHGAAVQLGLPLEELSEEVHYANMAKVRDLEKGDPKKLHVMKPSGWEPPDIALILERAGWADEDDHASD